MTLRLPSRSFVQKLFGLFGLLLCGVAFGQDPKIRTHLESQGTLWTGQRITLAVELLVPGIFTSAATVDLPDPPGVILIRPEEHPLVSNETIGDVTYTVQRHELWVYAASAGEHVVPPIRVRFAFRRGYLDRQDIPALVTTEPVRLSVQAPPGTGHLGQVVSARGLKAEETWQPQPDGATIKAGDAFTRTITVTAPDLPGMVLPPFPTGKIDGLRLYPKPPVLLDHADRGTFSGGRRDTLVYVCERPGRFVIPATRSTWWDLDAQELRTVDFPARILEVAPNPALGASPKPPATVAATTIGSNRWWAIGVGALVVLALATLARRSISNFLGRLFAPLQPVHLQPLNPER